MWFVGGIVFLISTCDGSSETITGAR